MRKAPINEPSVAQCGKDVWQIILWVEVSVLCRFQIAYHGRQALDHAAVRLLRTSDEGFV